MASLSNFCFPGVKQDLWKEYASFKTENALDPLMQQAPIKLIASFNVLMKETFSELILAIEATEKGIKVLERKVKVLKYKKKLRTDANVNKEGDVLTKSALSFFLAKSSLTPQQKVILPKVNRFTTNLYAGAYPGAKDDFTTAKMQDLLVNDLGITHFLCLIDNNQLKKFNSYMGKCESVHDPVWMQFEIEDGKTASDERVQDLMTKIIPLAKDPNNRIYVHCWGGNGRTSTISTVLLSKLYGINWEESLTHIFKCYLNRKDPLFNFLPETVEQFDQIKRLCGGPNKSYHEWQSKCFEIAPKKSFDFDLY